MNVWFVWAWSPPHMQWTLRSSHDTEDDARDHAEALHHKNLRVRVERRTRRVPPAVKPVIANATRDWRVAQAGQMMDLADAKKKYKSPG